MSATALLQKAAQMGVTTSNPAISMPHQHQQSILLNGSQQTLQQDHMCAPLLSSQHHHHQQQHLSNLSSSGNNHHVILEQNNAFANVTSSCMDQLLHHTTPMTSTNVGSTNIHDIFNGMLNSTKQAQASSEKVRKEGGGANDELTRDFLGLRGFPNPNDHQHFLNMASLDHMNHQLNSNPNPNQNQNQIPWQG